jgi:predicted GNAT superfamily acetyltransferase
MPAAPPPRTDDVTIRPITTEAEYEACVRLQFETWGHDFHDAVPISLLRMTQRLGGVTAGAFDGRGTLLGFVFGMTGVMDGQLVHWSDMLAVAAAARDRGIGQRLKLYQRDALRALGIHTMYWTYDPLVARNAHLNLVRLGARPTEYVENFYGADTGSPLHGSLGTDRFIVAWDLDAATLTDDAAAAAAGAPDEPVTVNAARDGEPPRLSDLPDAPVVQVEIPPDIAALMEQAGDVARAWRLTTRRAFSHYLPRGYRVVGFSSVPETGRCFYTLHSPAS